MTVNHDYQHLLKLILLKGKKINSRNAVVYRKVHCSETFNATPLVSIRKTAWKSALREMEWFLSGSNNINDLHPSVHPWWKPWADENGEIKNNYGKQFKDFHGRYGSVDQIECLIQSIKKDPYSRRHVITAWNTSDMFHESTPITNCHSSIIQAFCFEEGLQLLMYQRSADMILGVPHNWIQHWAFLLWLGKQTNKNPQFLTWIGGDCHIYDEHYDIACRIINQKMEPQLETPELIYKGSEGSLFKADDFELLGDYKPILTSSPKMIV